MDKEISRSKSEEKMLWGACSHKNEGWVKNRRSTWHS